MSDATEIFVRARPRLYGIAYRIVRNRHEAEDIVQETWLRWQRTDRAVVLNADAFLATTTTRLALNVKHSAWCRRESTSDPLAPEFSASSADPERDAERSADVEHAVLLMLGVLTPAERATYVLREAFGYPYELIADVLQCSSANCRQLARRAKLRIASGQRRPVGRQATRRFLAVFRSAVDGGSLRAFEDMLRTDVMGG